MTEHAPLPSPIDMDRLGRDLEPTPPTEVTKFAPSKYRTPTTLGQLQSDLRKELDDIDRLADELKQRNANVRRMLG